MKINEIEVTKKNVTKGLRIQLASVKYSIFGFSDPVSTVSRVILKYWKRCVLTSFYPPADCPVLKKANSCIQKISGRDRLIFSHPIKLFSEEVSSCFPVFWRLPTLNGPNAVVLIADQCTIVAPKRQTFTNNWTLVHNEGLAFFSE